MDIKQVASFGASTAQGVGDFTEQGFIGRLGTLLDKPSLNFGIGGNTTRDMLARLADLNIPEDSLVIVSLGINDVARINEDNPNRVPLEEYKENVSKILDALLEKAQVFYKTQFPVDFENKGIDADFCRSYVKTALAVAQSKNIPSLDLIPLLEAHGNWQAFLAADGIHFNDDGHAFMAQALFTALQALPQ